MKTLFGTPTEYHRFEDGGFSARVSVEHRSDHLVVVLWSSDANVICNSLDLAETSVDTWFKRILTAAGKSTLPIYVLVTGINFKPISYMLPPNFSVQPD